MRKWFYAGAVVGGFLLLGAAPAQADVVPAPAGGLLGSLGGGATQGLGLDPAGGLNLASPLDGSSLMDVKPGQNSADLTGPASGLAAQDEARTRVIAVAQFMVVLDVTIVNVALPDIQRDLGFSA
ncbi:hypothetical protein AB0C29_36760, partial [Actinoplanes sp. NPDC048791]|uniref:hypothetical protein n=1 Tax=Actinoplanes sp. NPDC048791 TaxID=3154623 RepID=UPI0033DC9F80